MAVDKKIVESQIDKAKRALALLDTLPAVPTYKNANIAKSVAEVLQGNLEDGGLEDGTAKALHARACEYMKCARGTAMNFMYGAPVEAFMFTRNMLEWALAMMIEARAK